MRTLSILMAIVMLTGCTFTMVGNAPKTEATVAQTKTVNATFARSEQFINACSDPKAHVAEIRYHTNAAYLLVSILSFGFYVPENVTWWCSTEAPKCAEGDTSGDCEPYVPGDD